MTALKSVRTLAASLGVLAIGAMAASPAMAFDDVDWDWHKDVKETVDIDVDIDIDLESTGLVEIEKLQIFLGNVTATSTVHDINNKQYDRDQYVDLHYPVQAPMLSGKYDRGYNFCYCYPEVDIDEAAFDAVYQLPSVVSAATAVGNNQSITSDVPVFLHDGQFVANTLGNYYDWDTLAKAMPGANSVQSPGGGYQGGGEGNLHTDLAILFTLASGIGFLTPAEIKATSTVFNIKNATVDSTATAVANNLSVTLESEVDGTATAGLATVKTGGGQQCQSWDKNCHNYPNPTVSTPTLSNHVVIADITQFAYANVSAVSNVCDVSLNEYSNLSPNVDPVTGDLLGNKLGRPIVNSVATAVGNNVSITVGVPSVD
ncbi:MAG: hypothetical protein SGI91_14755 [Alphaproteobacteria bacterium]|nr:hypothetical protein [Alphaproteobacteria bacterium]